MQKHPSKHIFIEFAENSHFPRIFEQANSLAAFTLSAKKLICTKMAILASFNLRNMIQLVLGNFD